MSIFRTFYFDWNHSKGIKDCQIQDCIIQNYLFIAGTLFQIILAWWGMEDRCIFLGHGGNVQVCLDVLDCFLDRSGRDGGILLNLDLFVRVFVIDSFLIGRRDLLGISLIILYNLKT